MFPFIRIPPIDPFSFWIGFISAIILTWVLARIKPLFAQIRSSWKEQQEAAQIRRSSSLEEHHRQNILRQAQGMHLAAPLFALDEILIQPQFLAPPARLTPGDPPPPEDAVTHSLPYLPAWPELSAIYQAPTLSLAEALSGGANLAFVGQPGAGKTVTLAHLASLLARNELQAFETQNAIPFLVHIADLNIAATDPKEILNPIVNAVSEYAPLLDLPRLPNFVQYAFASGKAFLLIDGLDELPQAEISQAAVFIGSLLKEFPKTRIVTTACPEYIDGLHDLGFRALALLPWTQTRQKQFLLRWSDVWTRFVSLETWAQSGPENIDPILLNAWLENDNAGLTPLEMTLKVWGAYAGDGLGPGVLDGIECHLRRIAPANIPPAALETLAMQVTLTAQPIFDTQKARDWVRSFEPPEERAVEQEQDEEETPAEEKPHKGKPAEKAAPAPGLLPKMADSGLLFKHPNNRMRFCHPVIGAYLAGRALAAYQADENLREQPAWSGQVLAMRFLAAFGDANALIESLLAEASPPLEQPLLLAARCLREAPRQAPWRGKVMAALAALLQNEGLPLGLRCQAVAAFALSRDPGAGLLFRQLLSSQSSEILRLAALGSGALRDNKATDALAALLNGTDFYTRRAACLALVAIGSAGNTTALETIAASLLNGDEDLRRAAAESLANDPQEGYAMLQDGITLADILVRRASVYGLGRVKEDWAGEILEKAQVEDEQWIVRSAASEVIENRTRPNPYIPKRLTPPSETPWLIAFAGTQGMGISPGTPATEILQLALKSENMDERLAALPYLCQSPSPGVIGDIYNAMYGGEMELGEAAFQAIWDIAASGAMLPNPYEFGLG